VQHLHQLREVAVATVSFAKEIAASLDENDRIFTYTNEICSMKIQIKSGKDIAHIIVRLEPY
jgi:hypothetical protein